MPLDPSDSTFWAMLEAIGTITASVIALFTVIYFEIIRPRRNRPTLQINDENRAPYSAFTELVLGGKPPRIHTSQAKQIRLGVLNS